MIHHGNDGAGLEQFGGLAAVHRRAEIMPLGLHRSAGGHQRGALFLGLDALGDDADAHVPGKVDDGPQGHGVVGVVVGAVEQALGELEVIDPIGLEVIERGVLGAEIIDGHLNPQFTQARQHVVVGPFGLGEGGFGDIEAQVPRGQFQRAVVRSTS